MKTIIMIQNMSEVLHLPHLIQCACFTLLEKIITNQHSPPETAETYSN
jgi:hypothetical protein